jgi:hypothetical protein
MKTLSEKKVEQWRGEILAELVALAESDEGTGRERRRKALELIDELKVTDRMLSNIKPSPTMGNYTVFRDPSDAVVAFLRDLGRPATEDEIIDGVFEGGFRGGEKDEHRHSVDLAIRNRLTGTGCHNEKLGLKGDIRGLIGLREWDDSLFTVD